MLALFFASLCATAAPLADGVALYQGLEFERAAIHFQGMVLDTTVPAGERAQAAMWAGLSLGQLGDVEGARKAFALAVSTDPQVRAPPDAPPALRAILEEERARAPAAPPIESPVATPPPPTPAPPVVDDGPDVAAIGAGVAAGVLVVAAAGAGLYGAMRYATAADPTVPARPAFEAYDASVIAGWTALALGGGAAVAGGVSAALFLVE